MPSKESLLELQHCNKFATGMEAMRRVRRRWRGVSQQLWRNCRRKFVGIGKSRTFASDLRFIHELVGFSFFILILLFWLVNEHEGLAGMRAPSSKHKWCMIHQDVT